MSSKTIDFRDSRWLRLIRLYTFNFPINKGKGRIFRLAKKLCRELPRNATVTTEDGRRLQISLRAWPDDFIYFLGTYESFCTSVISKYVGEGSVCLDVGANIGWFTTLFQSLCGPTGQVHSFEPAPEAFDQLRRNVSLNKNSSRVSLNNLGLGDSNREAKLHVFAGLPEGHATMAAAGTADSVSYRVNIRTLDSYLVEKNIDHVDAVKVDIEGAELMFLKGAVRLFEQKRPPVIMMEMSPQTATGFGHSPNDLIALINSRRQYDLFVVNEQRRTLEPLTYFEPGQAGANVLCIPRETLSGI